MGVIARIWTGRAARKFRRSRVAVAALAVILVYALIGIWLTIADVYTDLTRPSDATVSVPSGSVFTAFTLERVDERVGALTQRGWLETETLESRARQVKYYTNRVAKALRLKDPVFREEAVRTIRFGDRKIDMPIDELRGRVEAIESGYNGLDRFPDLDALEGSERETAVSEVAALEQGVHALFAPISATQRTVEDLKLSLGTDRQGRSTFARAVYSIKVALQIGLVVGALSVLLGAILGAAAGYYGGWIDQAVQWLYSTLSSVPDLVLLAVLAYIFTGSYFDDNTKPFISLIPVYVAMCMTFWIAPARVIRGETLKLKELEYVQAAKAIGYSRPYILLRHILPNTVHLMFINFSLLFIAAIKFEVVLSFLGLGVKAGPSWGRMIGEATQEVINGNFWQIGAATVLMFVLVLAFNVVSDALQDAFDPKHVG